MDEEELDGDATGEPKPKRLRVLGPKKKSKHTKEKRDKKRDKREKKDKRKEKRRHHSKKNIRTTVSSSKSSIVDPVPETPPSQQQTKDIHKVKSLAEHTNFTSIM